MNVATQRRSDLSTIAPDRSAARMPGTGPLRRSSGPVRNQAIVGKSRIGATLHRCEPSVFLLHTNHFPVAGTLDHAHTFFHPQTQQYESPPNTAKSSLNLTPKRDIHAEPVHTRSPTVKRINRFLIFPERWASTRWLLESSTRNIVPGSTAVIFPSTTIELSVGM
jgi:hypothetical protein